MREGEKKRGNEGVAEERKERKGNKSGMEEYRTEETGGITVGGGAKTNYVIMIHRRRKTNANDFR